MPRKMSSLKRRQRARQRRLKYRLLCKSETARAPGVGVGFLHCLHVITDSRRGAVLVRASEGGWHSGPVRTVIRLNHHIIIRLSIRVHCIDQQDRSLTEFAHPLLAPRH